VRLQLPFSSHLFKSLSSDLIFIPLLLFYLIVTIFLMYNSFIPCFCFTYAISVCAVFVTSNSTTLIQCLFSTKSSTSSEKKSQRAFDLFKNWTCSSNWNLFTYMYLFSLVLRYRLPRYLSFCSSETYARTQAGILATADKEQNCWHPGCLFLLLQEREVLRIPTNIIILFQDLDIQQTSGR
jgi:hypothetical protein